MCLPAPAEVLADSDWLGRACVGAQEGRGLLVNVFAGLRRVLFWESVTMSFRWLVHD